MEIRPILSTLKHNKTGALLIAAQVALTLAIISNATFVIRDRLAIAERLTGVDDETRVITQRPILNSKINLDTLQRVDLDALRALPGVESASVVNQVPLGRSGWNSSLALENKPSAPTVNAGMYFDGGDLLKTFGLKLIEGRAFTADEITVVDPETSVDGPSLAIVTLDFAKAMFGESPSYVGKTFYEGNSAEAQAMQVVGVIERLQTPWAQSGPQNLYNVVRPMRLLTPYNYYAVRAQPGAEAQVRKAMDEALAKNEPDRVSTGTFSIGELRDKRYRGERAVAWLLMSVTGFLLIVTASGIVGMVSLWVNLRRKQIGVRRALGATKADIVRYFLTENAIITSAGIVAGVIAARALNALLMQELSVPRLPWENVLGGIILLAFLGLGSVLWPAIRASRLSPALATRSI